MKTMNVLIACAGFLLFCSPVIASEWFEKIVPGGRITGYLHGQFPSLPGKTHVGVDIGGECGLDVKPPVAGEIVKVIADRSDQDYSSLGYMVKIRHDDTSDGRPTYTVYLHLQTPPLKRSGSVTPEDTIGYVGETGAADGCHVHFEVRHFDGVRGFFNDHPQWLNIYGTGDWRNTDLLRQGWSDPAEWVSRVALDVRQFGPSIVSEADSVGCELPIHVCLSKKGDSAEVVSFHKFLANEHAIPGGSVEYFREFGSVDIAGFFYTWMANSNNQIAMVNSNPFVVWASSVDANLLKKTRHPVGREVMRRYPQAFLDTGRAGFQGYRVLPNGDQLFVFGYAIMDRCRACNIVGSVGVGFRFSGGRLKGREVQYIWFPPRSIPDVDNIMQTEVLRRHPHYLQLVLAILGYDPGPIDGVPGPRTSKALSEFQAEQCIAATGALNEETLRALVQVGKAEPELPPTCGTRPRDSVATKRTREEIERIAVEVLLGDPYGVTRDKVREHISGVEFSRDPACGDRQGWEVTVFVPGENGNDGIEGTLTISDDTGEVTCSGLPFLDFVNAEEEATYILNENANRIFVEAVQFFNLGTEQSDNEKVVSFRSAMKRIEAIRRDYASSNIGKRIIGGEPLGVLDLAYVQTEIARIEAGLAPPDETNAATRFPQFAQRFPRVFEAFWEPTDVETWVKETASQALELAITISVNETFEKLLLEQFNLNASILFEAALQNPQAAADAAFHAVGQGVAEDLVIDLAASFIADAVMESRYFQGMDALTKAALGGVLKGTASEAAHIYLDVSRKGALGAAISGAVRRVVDVVDIYRETAGLVSTQDHAFLATALAVQSSVDLQMTVDTDKARAIADSVYREVRSRVADIYGKDDEAAVQAIMDLAREALIEQKRGNATRALELRAEMVRLGKAGGNLNLFAAFRPVDFLAAAARWGKDAPERAVEILISATSLAKIDGSSEPVETSVVDASATLATRRIKSGETWNGIVLNADGSATFNGELLFPTTPDAEATVLDAHLSPNKRYALVVQVDLEWGGLRAVLVDFTGGKVINGQLIPENKVRISTKDPQNVLKVSEWVDWSPDSSFGIFGVEIEVLVRVPVVFSTLTGKTEFLYAEWEEDNMILYYTYDRKTIDWLENNSLTFRYVEECLGPGQIPRSPCDGTFSTISLSLVSLLEVDDASRKPDSDPEKTFSWQGLSMWQSDDSSCRCVAMGCAGAVKLVVLGEREAYERVLLFSNIKDIVAKELATYYGNQCRENYSGQYRGLMNLSFVSIVDTEERNLISIELEGGYQGHWTIKGFTNHFRETWEHEQSLDKINQALRLDESVFQYVDVKDLFRNPYEYTSVDIVVRARLQNFLSRSEAVLGRSMSRARLISKGITGEQFSGETDILLFGRFNGQIQDGMPVIDAVRLVGCSSIDCNLAVRRLQER